VPGKLFGPFAKATRHISGLPRLRSCASKSRSVIKAKGARPTGGSVWCMYVYWAMRAQSFGKIVYTQNAHAGRCPPPPAAARPPPPQAVPGSFFLRLGLFSLIKPCYHQVGSARTAGRKVFYTALAAEAEKEVARWSCGVQGIKAAPEQRAVVNGWLDSRGWIVDRARGGVRPGARPLGPPCARGSEVASHKN
jgi:hypothetical protein